MFEQTLTVHEITEEDMKILVKFGLDDFGHFPDYCFDVYEEVAEDCWIRKDIR